MNSSTTNFNLTSSGDRWPSARGFVLALLATVFGLLAISALLRFTVLAQIAPRLSGNPSFDQKLMFVKKLNIGGRPVSLFAGSSMALNNLDTDQIAADSGILTLNLGTWSMSIAQSAELASYFVHRSRVKDMTLSAAFFEMVDGGPEVLPVTEKDINDYLTDSFWQKLERPLDILDAASTWIQWRSTYADPGLYSYAVFSPTGAALLSITKANADPERWNGQLNYSTTCLHCMDSVSRVCSLSHQNGIPFTLFMPPFREALHANPVYAELSQDRRARATGLMKTCGGRMFDADAYGAFDDSCFADWAHLNKSGAQAATRLFIEWKHGGLQRERRKITCPDPALLGELGSQVHGAAGGRHARADPR